MRLLPPLATLTLTAAAVLASAFVSAPGVEGALLPAPGRHAASLTCEPTALPRAERARFRKIAKAAPTILREVPAAVQRGQTASFDEGVAAIQSDAPAVPLDTGWRPAPLRPFGLIVGLHASPTRPGSFSRRSPRGPPFD